MKKETTQDIKTKIQLQCILPLVVVMLFWAPAWCAHLDENCVSFTVNVCPTGHQFLESQAELDAWVAAYPNCTTLDGELFLGSYTESTDIHDLSGLSNLTTLNVRLTLYNTQVTSLTGLENLTTLNNLNLSSNPQLTDISALSNLTSIGPITIQYNHALTSLYGLHNVGSAVRLDLNFNDGLTNLDELSNLQSVNIVRIWYNNNLSNIEGLSSLLTVGNRMEFKGNAGLTNLDGLENLTSIGTNLIIENNINLSNCCAIHELINTPAAIGGDIMISGNQTGCDGEAEVNYYCIDNDLDGFTFFDGDCDDSEMSISPNATEICDGIDNNCDGQIDEGLPCDFSYSPDGINCTNGNSFSYDPNTAAFTITSEGCYNPNFYSNADSQGFVEAELCGDGEIIAKVTPISGGGFAGLSMRQDVSAGSPLLQLGIDGVSLTKRSLRTSPGGLAFAHQFQTQGNHWLRLSRSGNTFGAYHSSDGINWMAVLVTNINMSNCIVVGLYTENSDPSGAFTAVFENVLIKTAVPLSVPATIGDVAVEHVVDDFNVFPNPASQEVNLQLGEFIGEEVQVRILHQNGQLMAQYQWKELPAPTQRIDLADWPSGIYVVELKTNEQRITQKLVVNH